MIDHANYNAAMQAEWRLQFALVDHHRIPKNLAWLQLSNRSAEDRLVCLGTQSWAVTIEELQRRNLRLFPGPGTCAGLERYQLVRAGTTAVIPLEVDRQELPTTGTFEFGFLFEELPWPPLLGEPESRSATWSGTLLDALENGKALIDGMSR